MKTAGIISFLIAVCALMGCNPNHDPSVETAYALAATDPTAALDSIAAIETLTLTKSDRMLLQLAKIKATDKAYLDLPGDSVILPLVDYYSSHESDRFYAEALYYAGRIYSESGDSPNALRYFQDAVDLLPENTPNKTLRGSVLGQTAGLLGRLHLIDEAIPYFEAVIKSDSLLQDTTNLIYDLADYAECLRWADRCDQALPLLNKALKLAQLTGSDFLPVLKMYISRIYLKKGDYKTAHKYIIPALDNIEDGFRKDAMVTVLKSYYLNEKYDSAYHLARNLLTIKTTDVIRRNSYYYLIQTELLNYSTPDSINCYRDQYLSISEKLQQKYTDQAPVLQRTFYNYSVHDRNRLKAERSHEQILRALIAVMFVTLVFIILYLIYKNRTKSNRIKLHQALEYIRSQKELINSLKRENETQKKSTEFELNKTEIRQILRKQYLNQEYNSDDKSLTESVVKSAAFQTLSKYASKGEGIPESNKVWRNIEKIINKEYPNFKIILEQLAGKSLKSQDYTTLILIKCGFTPTEISNLLFRSKSAISIRRQELSNKLFGEVLNQSKFDYIIRRI